LAHIDVVEARREDWARDPFTLVEENGYFYGRGSADDKAQASVWVDTLIRFKQEGFRPHRTVKMALTCGEETASAFNGARYLASHERELIDAAFALTESAGGWMEASIGALARNGADPVAAAVVETDPATMACCAPPASPPCSTPATRQTPCRSGRGPTSTAGSSLERRSSRWATSWRNSSP